MMVRTECGLCGGDSAPFVQAGDLGVRRCERCRTTFVASFARRGDGAEADHYATHYREELSATKAQRCWALLAEHVHDLPACRTVLDIGCGSGEFLDVARANGLATMGTEIAETSAAVARDRGHEVRVAPPGTPLRDAGTPRFDLVTLWDVLEHLEAPGQLLSEAVASVAPGGRLVILSPMMGTMFDGAGRALHRLSGGRADVLLRMCWSREHLYRFDPRGLATRLAELGGRSIRATSVLLLSLQPHRYAGGGILPRWTRSDRLNRLISVAGVAAARAMRVSNKVLVTARFPA